MTARPCAKCGVNPRRLRYAYCNPCHAEYRRAHRKKVTDPVEIWKRGCRALTARQIADGRLVRGACSVCGTAKRVEAHHPDYSDAGLVVWLCGPCHRAHHRKLGARAYKLGIHPRSLPEAVALPRPNRARVTP